MTAAVKRQLLPSVPRHWPGGAADGAAVVKGVACLVTRCSVTKQTPRELSEHLHMEHGWPMTKALDQANKMNGGVELKIEMVDDIPVHHCPNCNAVIACEWSAVAAIEEQARRLRIVAGQMRARMLGKTIGHATGSHYAFDDEQAKSLIASGLSMRATAKALGVSGTTVSRAVKKGLTA